ncbi:MAG: hypothetical protein LBE18_06075 [Planctomycetaceae bacterium]|jgi:hypothetical protein|nr:hypothetical protein [Planctomycetaceae bacterium]
MFKTIVLGTTFVLSFSYYAAAQEILAAADKPAENRLEVETADLVQPAGKGITPKKEHKGVVPRNLGKITKEQRETVRNLDKEYARLIDILQVRIDLLKKERLQKIKDLIKPTSQDQQPVTPEKPTTQLPTTTEKEKSKKR